MNYEDRLDVKRRAFAPLFMPTAYFFATGSADASWPLTAFDRALLSAGIGNVNLIRLSSILGAEAKITEPVKFRAGTFVAAAYSSIACSKPGQLIAAAIAIAHPRDPTRESVIMEEAGEFSAKMAEQNAIAMASEAMRSRQLKVRDIECASSEHTVERIGCSFAAVIQL